MWWPYSVMLNFAFEKQWSLSATPTLCLCVCVCVCMCMYAVHVDAYACCMHVKCMHVNACAHILKHVKARVMYQQKLKNTQDFLSDHPCTCLSPGRLWRPLQRLCPSVPAADCSPWRHTRLWARHHRRDGAPGTQQGRRARPACQEAAGGHPAAECSQGPAGETQRRALPHWKTVGEVSHCWRQQTAARESCSCWGRRQQCQTEIWQVWTQKWKAEEVNMALRDRKANSWRSEEELTLRDTFVTEYAHYLPMYYRFLWSMDTSVGDQCENLLKNLLKTGYKVEEIKWMAWIIFFIICTCIYCINICGHTHFFNVFEGLWGNCWGIEVAWVGIRRLCVAFFY